MYDTTKTASKAVFVLSGRRDLNPGPLQPHCSALAKLRHAPYVGDYNKESAVWQIEIAAQNLVLHCFACLMEVWYNR